jgi:enoyl-CoA hydratase/carnithine racemase
MEKENGVAHAQFALVPTEGETQRLPRRMGLLNAKELMLRIEICEGLGDRD